MRAPATTSTKPWYPVHCGLERHMSSLHWLTELLVIRHWSSAN